MKNVNFVLLILVIRKKYWRGREEILLNNGQYPTKEADLFNKRVILSILLCYPVDKHLHWTQLFSCCGFIPNVSPTYLWIWGIFISIPLSHAKWTREWCSFWENFSILFLLTSCHAEPSKNQAVIFSHSVKLL